MDKAKIIKKIIAFNALSEKDKKIVVDKTNSEWVSFNKEFLKLCDTDEELKTLFDEIKKAQVAFALRP